MADKDLIEKLTGGAGIENAIFYDNQRLKSIEYALKAMKNLNQTFLKKYELNEVWHKVNMGLIKHNIQVSLQNLVQFKICESNKPERSYFNPFSKRPITMCYNKFIKPQLFNQVLSYNMILYYDWRTKKNLNWNNLQDTVIANVRAITLSETCKKNDKACIRKQLESKVFEKQRFKGKTLNNLQQVIMKGLEDTSPISQIVVREN